MERVYSYNPRSPQRAFESKYVKEKLLLYTLGSTAYAIDHQSWKRQMTGPFLSVLLGFDFGMTIRTADFRYL